jgi:hypothetical protein
LVGFFFLWSGGELLIYVTMATAGARACAELTVSVFYPLRYDGENIYKKKETLPADCAGRLMTIVPVYRFPSTTRPARPTM